MRLSKWHLLGSVCVVVGVTLLLDFFKAKDPSRVTSHLIGIVMVLGLLPFMKWPYARFFQIWALAWLFGDVAFRNFFAPAAPIGTDAGAWRGVLALAYAAILTMIALYDRAIRQSQLQRVGSDPA